MVTCFKEVGAMIMAGISVDSVNELGVVSIDELGLDVAILSKG